MSKAVTDALKLLGHKVKDAVTETEGVVVSVSFDLYGCVQALVRMKAKELKDLESAVFWFDAKRLAVLSKKPVMEQPSFVEVPGGEARKPIPN